MPLATFSRGIAAVLAVLFFAGAVHSEGGHDKAEYHPKKARSPRPPVVIKMRRYNVPKPQAIKNPRHVVRDHAAAVPPERDERGWRIDKPAAVFAPAHHAQIVENRVVIHNIEIERRREVVPVRYYWHETSGIRYAHYYDHGIHWYGFYNGPTFYWTRFDHNRWWWFDVGVNRWLYWWGGYWWWASPAGINYIYIDDNYYPYEPGGVVVRKPEVQAAPESAPAAGEGKSFNSPDWHRRVQVFGAKDEAFLYDTSGPQPEFLKYLGQGVEKARYSGGAQGSPVQILLDFKDGNFAVFTADGEPQDTAPAPEDASGDSPPPPIPTTAPPLPSTGTVPSSPR
jgi:hypothetical protein